MSRLACPVEPCRTSVPVSKEDPDSSLDDVLRHMRSRHPEVDASARLADVRLIDDGFEPL